MSDPFSHEWIQAIAEAATALAKMKPTLTNDQVLQERAEISRRAMLMIAQADAELTALEAQAATMTIAEFNRQKKAIEDKRVMLRAEWEREKASWTK